MRKLILAVFAVLLISVSSFSQAPDSLNYQAVVRNANGQPIPNQNVGLEISILQGSAVGTVVYTETHATMSNKFGLVNLIIGGGSPTVGTFPAIDWSAGPYFVKVGLDPSGGTNYSTIMGTSQLLSVPYALHANVADSVLFSNAGDGFNTGDYGTVVNPITGKVWLDRNLGATQVADSLTDENSYGDLYQWGRNADGHQIRDPLSGTTGTQATDFFTTSGDFIIGFGNWLSGATPPTHMWSGTAAENNPCPSGFRIPTAAEWNQERLTWTSNNAAGAFASPLKLPMAGFRFSSDGALYAVGTGGSYWSSTVEGAGSRNLNFGSSNASMSTGSRALGLAVRCLKD